MNSVIILLMILFIFLVSFIFYISGLETIDKRRKLLFEERTKHNLKTVSESHAGQYVKSVEVK